jgi:hypothetical protein
MGVTEFLQAIGERYGLLPVYALIIGFGGFTASSLRSLVFVLGIMLGVYVTMFRAFNLGAGVDVFELAARFQLSADVANGIAATIFVFGIGFAAFGLKRLLARKTTA